MSILLSCEDLRRRAGKNFVLYNVWCRPEGGSAGKGSSVHHFYDEKTGAAGAKEEVELDEDGTTTTRMSTRSNQDGRFIGKSR